MTDNCKPGQTIHAASHTLAQDTSLPQTHHRVTENAKEKARFRSLLEAVPDAMLLVSQDGRILQVNAQTLMLFGYTREELTDRPVEILLPERFREGHSQHRTSYFAEPRTRLMGAALELQGLRKDGREFPLEISISHLETEDGALAIAAVRDITERKRAEEAQRAREQQFRKVFEEGPIGIALVNLDFQFVHVNARFCEMLGYTEEELQPLTFPDITHPEDADADVELARCLFLGEIPRYTMEKRYVRKNGEVIWIHLFASVLHDADKRPVYGLAMVEDITARKEVEAALRASEERYRSLVEQAADGIFIADQTGRYVDVNPNGCGMIGYSHAELLQRSIADIVTPEEIERIATVLEAMKQGLIHRGEWQFRRKDNSTFPGEVSATMLSDGRVLGILRDITERKRAEIALRESEERFRQLADSAPVMVWMTDASGECTYLNKAWLEFTGHTQEEGLAFGWSEDIHPEDRKTKMEESLRCFAARQPIRSELRLRRYDGQYRYVLDVGVPRLSEDGNLLGYIGSCVDITEQKMMQERLFESQKLESLGRLAGGIAHDFNNLLTAITGYTELAQMEVSSESEVAKFLTNVQSAAERAAALTKQLLMYARRQMVEFTPVNLNQVILGMDPLLRRTIGESYELVLSLEEHLGNVSTNASQIEQVLMNLIVNARDAMPGGGRIVVETANVTLDTDYAELHPGVTPGDYAMFTVSDNGPGMAKETLERIFEPFFTTKEMGKGTGLGLATCYGIVKQSRGNIEVYSELGQGTTFKVYMPRLQETPIIEEAGPKNHLPSGTETVLLVDDEPMVRDIAAKVLRSQGYQVLEASNGVDAMHIQSEWKGTIDLLVTDMVMPLMSGMELAQRLQQSRPDIRVLYMSGYTHNVILDKGVLKPDVALITKPFTSSDLVIKVHEILNAEQAISTS